MVVRKMTLGDLPQIAQLYKQFGGEDSSIETMSQEFTRLHNNDAYILLSAVEGNTVVGSVMGIVCGDLYGHGRPFMVLENMIVGQEHRNRGIGKALISKLEEAGIGRGCSQIILVTESNRIDACKFYESQGYDPNTQVLTQRMR